MTTSNAPNSTSNDGVWSPSGASRRTKIVRGIIGLALFVLAIAAVALSGPSTHETLARLGSVPPFIIVIVLALPVLNLLLTGMSFHALTRRFGYVGVREMLALITAAFVLNFLPLRPGLFGRVAYHKKFNGIRVRDSARVIVESIACSAIAMGLLLFTLILARIYPQAAVGFIGMCTLMLVIARFHAMSEQMPKLAAYSLATLIKLVDTLVWASRYWLVFWMLGKPIKPLESVALAVVANAASLVPLSGNGMGLREWAIGLVAASFPRDQATRLVVETGLSADLVNRAAEFAVAICIGIPAVIWVSRRVAREP